VRADSLDFSRMLANHDREVAESEQLRTRAMEAADRAKRVAAKIDAMNNLYRERLIGVRKNPQPPHGGPV
jgi:TFIIF-interacting CTD phosphatase-like protein